MNRRLLTVSAAVVSLLAPPVAAADDTVAPPVPAQQHNITYRARVDGLARGALITYRISDSQVNSANPTMLPGRTFEATAVLTDAGEAGMRISIQWPYSASLRCEILVDDQTVAAASQFIAPKLTPARDDPDYGALNCGAPLSNATGLALPADPGGPLPGPADPGGPLPGPADPGGPLPGPSPAEPGALPAPADPAPAPVS